MKTLVVYGSRFGNTRRIAEAVGDGLKAAGPVEVLALEEATPARVRESDFIVVGGPTEGHTATPALKTWIDGMANVLDGKPVAAYDTRIDMARILTGSAASGISARLRRAGANVVSSNGSFLVTGKPAVLEPGELARALEWGKGLAHIFEPEPAVPTR